MLNLIDENHYDRSTLYVWFIAGIKSRKLVQKNFQNLSKKSNNDVTDIEMATNLTVYEIILYGIMFIT